MLGLDTVFKSVLVRMVGQHIVVLTLNRPAVRNAVDTLMASEVFSVVKAAEADPAVRVGILTGAGTVFSAGADLKEIADRRRDIRVPWPGGFAGFTKTVRAKPWIAALNGSAYGGGAELAFACEMAVMADNGVFALTEVKRGLVALGGGAIRAARALPLAIAHELLLTGAPMTATRAYDLGLVNRLAPACSVLEEAMALATSVASASPYAVRASLRLARLSQDEPIETMWRHNDHVAAALADTPDYKEGPRAFLQKRAPRWID